MMKHHYRFLVLLSALLLWVSPSAWGEAFNPASTHWVRNISMSDGLSHNYVDDIFRDTMGFMWIATSGSLARYDGYEFVDFRSNSIDRNIRSTHVRKVAEDGWGRLWVASDGGIDVIDLMTLQTVMPKDNSGIFPDVADIPAGYVAADIKGNIWVRNRCDVVCLLLDGEGAVTGVLRLPHKSSTVVTTSAIKPVAADDDGVWTSVGGRVCHLTISGGEIKCEPLAGMPEFPAEVYVSDYIGYGSCLWIATDRGLYRHNPKDNSVTEYHGGDALTQDYVTSLTLTGGGDLLAGTLNGFNIYNRADGSFSHVRTSDISSSLGGVGNNFINCMYAGGDDLWIGTEGCGVDLVSPRFINAELLCHDRFNGRTLSPNPVNAILEDGDGTLWVGTVEGGLNRSFTKEGGFDHYTMEMGTLPHNSVSALAADHMGHLWVGTWGGGVCVLPRHDPSHAEMFLSETTDTHEKIIYCIF